jgi:hypothetical protein
VAIRPGYGLMAKSILDRSDQWPTNLVWVQVPAEYPFGQEAPVFVTHKHLCIATLVAVFFGKFDSGDHCLRLTGVLGESSATLDDCPSIVLAYDHVSKVEHDVLELGDGPHEETIKVRGSFP